MAIPKGASPTGIVSTTVLVPYLYNPHMQTLKWGLIFHLTNSIVGIIIKNEINGGVVLRKI